MKRPEEKDYALKGRVNEFDTHSYSVALDKYIDYLESQVSSKNEIIRYCSGGD